jgi:hypothetical protein
MKHSSETYDYYSSPLVETIQVIVKGKKYGDRYANSMLLTNLSMGEVRIHFTQGKLDDEINKNIGVICRKMGYKKAQMEVPTGTPCTRYAKFEYSDGVLDRYTVDLMQDVFI